MGNVRFVDNKVLFDKAAVAMHEDCCCDVIPGDPDCCDGDSTPQFFRVTFAGLGDCELDCTLSQSVYVLEWVNSCHWFYTDGTETVHLFLSTSIIPGFEEVSVTAICDTGKVSFNGIDTQENCDWPFAVSNDLIEDDCGDDDPPRGIVNEFGGTATVSTI